MKKSILMLAFSALVMSSFAFNGGDDAKKKECTKKEKSCCKKDGKTCDKKDAGKTDSKTTDKK